MKKRTNTICPIVYSLDIWGDPWSLVILRDALMDNKRFYRDFLSSPEGIATNILSARLQSLTDAGLLVKIEDESNRAKTTYQPTQKAVDLLPALLSVMQWGMKYNPNTDLSVPIMWEVSEDKDKVNRRLVKQLQAE
jgi:DNA-binding HxlR family transcriptional regulator